ncbi:MAG TPA: PilZ domain-containing protein [Nitrospira sp.]|nr:PilZ domain-containing protein [Nitrospira sp.]
MRMQPVEQPGRAAEKADHMNHRLTERVPTQFNLMYSGMHEGQMLIGNGMVTNLSVAGIGIRGNHIVKTGMELALFIDLPGIEEPVCVAQSRVSWVSGRRFGVEMIAPKLEALNQLRFYVWNYLFRPPYR